MSIIENLFGKNGKELSKVDNWKKWEFFELLDYLHIALRCLSEFDLIQKETKILRLL